MGSPKPQKGGPSSSNSSSGGGNAEPNKIKKRLDELDKVNRNKHPQGPLEKMQCCCASMAKRCCNCFAECKGWRWCQIVYAVFVAALFAILAHTDVLQSSLNYWHDFVGNHFGRMLQEHGVQTGGDALRWRLVHLVLLFHGLMHVAVYSRRVRHSSDRLSMLALVSAIQSGLPVGFVFHWVTLIVLTTMIHWASGMGGSCCNCSLVKQLCCFMATGYSMAFMLGSVVSPQWITDVTRLTHVSGTMDYLRIMAQEFLVAYFPAMAF